MKRLKNRMGDTGFTLLELVVAVGILMILSVVGSVAYQGVLHSQKKETMRLTALTVVNKITSNIMDFDPNTSVKMAVDDFNNEVNNGTFNIYTIVDEAGCVNVVVEDTDNRVDPVYRTKDKLCNLSEEEIG